MTNDTRYQGTLYRLEFDVPHHLAIAAAAQRRLTPEASAEVAKLLGLIGCTAMSDVAGWADQVKRRRTSRPTDDPYTADFIDHNPGNGDWHYVDLPFGCSAYDPDKYQQFCAKDNVVSIIVECIRVFSKQSTRFSPLNALRLLVHLVGDLHQPLHVGCSYFRTSTNPVSLTGDPATILAENLPKDKGGNLLILPPDANGVNLHAYWDGGLGGDVDGPNTSSSTESAVSSDAVTRAGLKILANCERGKADESQQGMATDLLALPPEWANRSLEAARKAYFSISVVAPRADVERHPKDVSYTVTWEGRDAYNARCREILIERMTQGATNLADVLNTLFRS